MIHGFRVRKKSDDEYIRYTGELYIDGLGLLYQHHDGDNWEELDTDDCIIELSAGLPDRNGVAVHDGDVMRGMICDKWQNIHIKHNGFRWEFRFEETKWWAPLFDSMLSSWEIIGTIHDEEFKS